MTKRIKEQHTSAYAKAFATHAVGLLLRDTGTKSPLALLLCERAECGDLTTEYPAHICTERTSSVVNTFVIEIFVTRKSYCSTCHSRLIFNTPLDNTNLTTSDGRPKCFTILFDVCEINTCTAIYGITSNQR